MSLDVCGVLNPDVPSLHCDLPANHGRVKELWLYGQWMDHLSRAEDAGWVIPPNDERDEAIVTSASTAMVESADFVELFIQGLIANGYEITKRPSTGSPSPGAHAGS